MKKVFASKKFKVHQAARARYQLKRRQWKRNRKRMLLTVIGSAVLPAQKLRMTKARRAFIKNFYRHRETPNETRPVVLPGQIGIEHNLDQFLDFGSRLFSAITRDTKFDFTNTLRIWPSSLTQIVSYVEWVRLISGNAEILRSIKPNSSEVEEYLVGSGFYRWVGNRTAMTKSDSRRADVVELEKFVGRGYPKSMHWKIEDLIATHSGWTADYIERFSCVALSEALINVTEHGLNHRYQGWFILAQRHPTSGFLSICIGDNGIGIRNSLLTGNQVLQIKKLLRENATDDEFVKLALEKQVSGAIDSADLDPTFFGFGKPDVPAGKRRGRGLKRIVACCRELGVTFTVISRKGAVQVPGSHAQMSVAHRQSACFAGTLYHFNVPIGRKKE